MNETKTLKPQQKGYIATLFSSLAIISTLSPMFYHLFRMAFELEYLNKETMPLSNFFIGVGISILLFFILIAFEFKMCALNENSYSKMIKKLVNIKGVISIFTFTMFSFVVTSNIFSGNVEHFTGSNFFEVFLMSYLSFTIFVLTLFLFQNSLSNKLMFQLMRDLLLSLGLTLITFLVFG